MHAGKMSIKLLNHMEEHYNKGISAIYGVSCTGTGILI
jgi:hypothetical protein